jgi:hypothetical protein
MATTDSQHLADLLAAQFLLLWPLDPSERIRRINAVRKDLEYENLLCLVSEHMESA